MLLAVVGAMIVAGCAGSAPRATFQEGVELVPGPGYLLIRIEPPDAAATRQIRVMSGVDGRVVLFASHEGKDRYVSGMALPSTVTVWVDGNRCDGSLDVISEVEYDMTLKIDEIDCSLTFDRSHPPGAINHVLEDDGPVAS
jgi:hypothetical protein